MSIYSSSTAYLLVTEPVTQLSVSTVRLTLKVTQLKNATRKTSHYNEWPMSVSFNVKARRYRRALTQLQCRTFTNKVNYQIEYYQQKWAGAAARVMKNRRNGSRLQSKICAVAQFYDNLFSVFYRYKCSPDICKVGRCAGANSQKNRQNGAIQHRRRRRGEGASTRIQRRAHL